MSTRKKSDAKQSSGFPCNREGCREPGDFKAPRSRTNPRDFQWLCEAHVKEFNKSWNYFEGMSQDEIYAYQREATTGHRPTWRIDQLGNADRKMEEAFNRLFTDGRASYTAAAPPISAKTREALAVLDLQHPCSHPALKEQYRALVKKYHPDVNRGNSNAEETFKTITRAYHYLLDHYVEK